METISAVQEVWPKENPLFVRISATDWAEGGWTIEESVHLSTLLKEEGVDVVDTSSGGLTLAQQIPLSQVTRFNLPQPLKNRLILRQVLWV